MGIHARTKGASPTFPSAKSLPKKLGLALAALLASLLIVEVGFRGHTQEA